MNTRRLFVYIDGAARGNPGPAGIGIVIFDEENKKIKDLNRYIGIATNNIAEYNAFIYALKEAQSLGVKDVVLHTDSELLEKQLKGDFKVKNANIRPLFDEAARLINGLDRLEVKRIDRSLNKEADRLANKAINLSALNKNIE